MTTKTVTKTKLTVRLPDENLEFLKRYAKEHDTTVTDVLDRYLTRMRAVETERAHHPKVERLSGLAPCDADARALYHEHLLDKHR
jgi:hypothetical protein